MQRYLKQYLHVHLVHIYPLAVTRMNIISPKCKWPFFRSSSCNVMTFDTFKLGEGWFSLFLFYNFTKFHTKFNYIILPNIFVYKF